MDRLVSLEPSNEVPIRIEPGHRCFGNATLRNVMYTMPVAFRIQPMTPNRYTIRPNSGIIAPLATLTIEITYHLPFSSALPESIPDSDDSFLIDSVVVPGAAFKSKNSTASSDAVPAEWFTTKRKQVFTDSGMRVFFLGSAVLARLVSQGKMDRIREVLERSDPKWNAADSVDPQGQSLLHIAIARSRPDIVQLLLEFNPNLEANSRSGRTPIEAAAAIGESLIVELLLAHNASTERSPASKSGPIHLASSNGHLEVLRLLVLKRADVNATTIDGQTPLHLAAEGRHRDCAKLLLVSGARAGTRCGADGDTALHVAAAMGDESMVRLLIRRGGAGLKEVRNLAGKTAYNIAAAEGHGKLFDVLKLGDELAMAARLGEGRVVEGLIERGAVLNGRDQNGWTALMRAALKGRVDVMRSLMAKGAEVDARDEEGYTALHCAVEAGQVEAVEVIVKRGVDVEARTKKGATPMRIAQSLGYVGIERILAQAGAVKEAASAVAVPMAVAVAAAVEKQRMMMEGKKKKGSRGRSRLNRVAMPVSVASY